MAEDDGFLARWSRRKASHRHGGPLPEPVREAAVPPLPTPARATEAPPAAIAAGGAEPAPATGAAVDDAAPATPPPPTLADVAQLTRESDFARFVAPDVELEVKNAALKKLFADPQFNVMDGLDVYIDDYSKPDPLPKAMIKRMAQAAFLGLIDAPPAASAQPGAAASAEPANDPPPASGTPALDNPPCDENTDLRLQPHDAAGRTGAAEGAAGEPGPVEP